MKRLLIVAHAPSPNTLRLRSAIENGARNPDIEAVEVVVKAMEVVVGKAVRAGVVEEDSSSSSSKRLTC